jgi:hypothetical protein
MKAQTIIFIAFIGLALLSATAESKGVRLQALSVRKNFYGNRAESSPYINHNSSHNFGPKLAIIGMSFLLMVVNI